MGIVMEFNGRPVLPGEIAALGLTGYGHFTSMRLEDGRVRGLGLHLARLERDCRVLFDGDLDTGFVRHRLKNLAADAEAQVMVRITVFAPDLDLGQPARSVVPGILITTRPASPRCLPPIRLATVSYARDLPAVKHIGLMSTVYYRRAVQLNGFDDVLYTSIDGRISEGATWNIGFLDQAGDIVWPEADCLEGVTMRLVNSLAAGAGVASRFEQLSLDEAARMSSAFITNASIGLRPVACIGSSTFNESSLLSELGTAYAQSLGDTL